MISSISSMSYGVASTTPVTPSGLAKGDGKDDLQSVLDSFKKAAAETPMQRARDAVLKKHGLTDDSFNQLPADQKSGIEQEIAEAVQRAMPKDARASSDSVATRQIGGFA